MDRICFFETDALKRFKYGSAVTPEYRGRLLQLFEVYDDTFLDKLKGGVTSAATFSIKTISGSAISKKSRLTPTETNILRQRVYEMVDCGYLKESESEWSSPVEPKFVENKWEVFCNFSALNSITVASDFDVPSIPHVLGQVGSSPYYTRMRLIDAFHQLPLDQDSSYKTAFECEFGNYEFTSYTFNLKNGINAIQYVMEKVLEKFILTNCAFVLHLGCVLIFERTPKRHIDLVEGMIVGPEGITIDPSKLRKIVETEYPKKKEQLKTFLILTDQFRGYVNNYESIIKPLRILTTSGNPFCFDLEAKTAFEKIKIRLLEAPPRSYY